MESIDILKIEDYHYQIIYMMVDSTYRAYKRLTSTNWQVYQGGEWSTLKSAICKELETSYQDKISTQ